MVAEETGARGSLRDLRIDFEDLLIGDELPVLDKGRMTSMHIMRWSAATENWHRIHYDEAFARDVDRLPDVLVNGSWKQQVLCQYIKDWAAPDGWLWRIRFRFLDMDVKNRRITVHGTITELEELEGYGRVGISIELRGDDDVTTTGSADAIVPLRGGPRAPYPFVPEQIGAGRGEAA